MRIKEISVRGLFGIFDHVIPLNMDERRMSGLPSYMVLMVLEKQQS